MSKLFAWCRANPGLSIPMGVMIAAVAYEFVATPDNYEAIRGVLLAVLLCVAALWPVWLWLAIFGGVGVYIADEKGRSKAEGFWFGVLLGPLGWILVALLRVLARFVRSYTLRSKLHH